MNIFIVHSGTDRLKAEKLKNTLHDGKNFNILYLQYKRRWKSEAKRLMKNAQMILYLVGEDSAYRKNIDWELKKALKYKKKIVCLFQSDEEKNNVKSGKRVLNAPLYVKNSFSNVYSFSAECVSSPDELKKIVNGYESNDYVDLINSVFDEDNEKLFEQYKMFAKTSEDLLTRRQNVNNFYMSANAAIITIIATAFTVIEENWDAKCLVAIVISIPGILMCHSWKQILQSYGTVNSSKMVILGIMEKKLPASLFQAEWQVMDCKYNKRPYVPFTEGEGKTPSYFKIVYYIIITLCCLALIWFFKENIYEFIKAFIHIIGF